MLRVVVIAAFVLHGLAHLSGFFASWTTNTSGFTDRPWILSGNVTLNSGLGRVFGLLWLVVTLCSVGAGIGLALQQPWWPVLAIAQAAVSLIVIVPWWNTVVPGSKVGAAFDVIVMVALFLPWREGLIEALR